MNVRINSFVAALAISTTASAQSTAMTYQGRLNTDGAPASGLHDFRFKLFNAASGGSQVGQPVCADNVPVASGLFVTPIDFGQQFASPNDRYLEIEVRANSGLNCSNASGFVVLAPRQLLTAAPLANHAKSAFALDAKDGGPRDAVLVDDEGEVGIGTTNPAVPLHIASDLEAVLIIQDNGADDSQQSGYVGFWNDNPTETAWVGFGTPGSTLFSIVNARPSGHIALLPTGNVGVGTTSPAAKLDVRGDIRLGSTGQFRATASEEALRIVRGVVDTHQPDGCNAVPTIAVGSGFTVERTDCGRYRITFTTPFAGTPVVTASGILGNGCAPIATTTSPSSTGVSIQVSCGDTDTDVGKALWSFSFIAIGPR